MIAAAIPITGRSARGVEESKAAPRPAPAFGAAGPFRTPEEEGIREAFADALGNLGDPDQPLSSPALDSDQVPIQAQPSQPAARRANAQQRISVHMVEARPRSVPVAPPAGAGSEEHALQAIPTSEPRASAHRSSAASATSRGKREPTDEIVPSTPSAPQIALMTPWSSSAPQIAAVPRPQAPQNTVEADNLARTLPVAPATTNFEPDAAQWPHPLKPGEPAHAAAPDAVLNEAPPVSLAGPPSSKSAILPLPVGEPNRSGTMPKFDLAPKPLVRADSSAVARVAAEKPAQAHLEPGAAAAISHPGVAPRLDPVAFAPANPSETGSPFAAKSTFATPVAPAHPAGSGNETFAALDAAGRAPSTVWTHAGSRQAEAGYQDQQLGWVAVRAQRSEEGIHAALVPESVTAAEALGSHLAGLHAHLAERDLPVASLSLSSVENRDAGSAMGSSSGQGNGDAFGQERKVPQTAAYLRREDPTTDHEENGFLYTGVPNGGTYVSVMA